MTISYWRPQYQLRVRNHYLEMRALLRCYAAYSQESRKDPWPSKMGPIGCPETSVKNCRYTLRDTPDKRRSHLLCGRSPKSQIVPWCSFLGRSAPAARRCRSKGPDLAPRTWLVRHSPSLYWRCGNMHRKEMRVWLWLWWQFPLICLRPWIWRNTLGDSRLESVGGAWRCQFLRYYGYRYHINKISVCTIGGLIMTGEKTKYLEKKISMVPRF